MEAENTFQGGPVLVNGMQRTLQDEDRFNPRFKPLLPEEDEAWKELIKCGGAGEVADTAEQQAKRYETANERSPETHPGLEEFCYGTPDVVITCSMDYLIKTWDTKSYKVIQEFEGHLNFVNQVVTYREDQILSCSDDYTCRLWKMGARGTTGKLLFTYWINMYPMKAVCALPGQRAAVGGLDKTVRIFSLVTGCTLFRMMGHKEVGPDKNFFQLEGCGSIFSVLQLRQNILASGSDDSTVRLWDIDTGKCLSVKIGHQGYREDVGEPGVGWTLSERFATVTKMCHLGKDGLQFASCSYDRTVVIWNVAAGSQLEVLKKFKAHGNGIVSIGYAGKNTIATCSGDKTVKIWKWDEEPPLLLCELKTRGIASDVCMIDDDTVFIAGGDATIRIYNWKEERDVTQFYAHDMTLQCCVGTTQRGRNVRIGACPACPACPGPSESMDRGTHHVPERHISRERGRQPCCFGADEESPLQRPKLLRSLSRQCLAKGTVRCVRCTTQGVPFRIRAERIQSQTGCRSD